MYCHGVSRSQVLPNIIWYQGFQDGGLAQT